MLNPTPRASAAAKAPAAPTKKPSKLASVARGKLARPPRCMFYGPEGVGKSSLAVDAGAIFLNIEDGLSELDAVRYTFREGDDRGDVANTLEEVYEAIDDLAESDHSYAAVAIDTVDALESRLLWPKVCKDHDEPTIESFGYGKGYTAALAEWARGGAKPATTKAAFAPWLARAACNASRRSSPGRSRSGR